MEGASRRTVIAGAAAVFAGGGIAAPPPSLTVGGWREALLVVHDPGPWISTLREVGGWEVLQRTEADRSLNRLWQLPAQAATEQVVMRNRGDTTGYIRLVRITGARQQSIRRDDHAWETGGISALDLRVVDLTATRAALLARGWREAAEPVTYEAYPGIEVIQWAPVSPDGIRLSFIQRLAPPLTGWPTLRQWSRVANAAIVTSDSGRSTAFFQSVLGFPVAGRSTALGNASVNVMGLPPALQSRVKTEIIGFRPVGSDGALELISMPEARGRDHATQAHPPNLGAAGLRFIVADSRGLATSLASRGVTTGSPVQPLRVGLQDCLAFSIIAPDGVWLEFVEPLS